MSEIIIPDFPESCDSCLHKDVCLLKEEYTSKFIRFQLDASWLYISAKCHQYLIPQKMNTRNKRK